MKKFITYSVLAFAAITTNAQALNIENPIETGLSEVKLLSTQIVQPISPSPTLLSNNAKIAIARLDGGRLIPTPHNEAIDWRFLDRRISHKITQLGANNYVKYIPEIPFQGQDTDNKIDEVRLTAANEGFDYVLIYGVGPDASWASFGKKALSETGLKISQDCKSWSDAKAKALLVDSFTGQVLGAVTADDIDHNIGVLADRVGAMVNELSSANTTKV